MSTSKDTLTYFLECLRNIPDVHAKAMFGEYGIYSWEKMFALACDGVLFLKTTPETIHLFEDTDTKAYPWSKHTAPVNPEWLEDSEKLTEVGKLTLEHTPMPKPKQWKTPKSS